MFAKFVFSWVKIMKKKLKDCLEGEHKKTDAQNCRNNQQHVWSNSYLKFKKDIQCGLAAAEDLPETHQEPTMAGFEHFFGKKKNKAVVFWAWPELMKGWKYHLFDISKYWKYNTVSS